MIKEESPQEIFDKGVKQGILFATKKFLNRDLAFAVLPVEDYNKLLKMTYFHMMELYKKNEDDF